MGRYSKEQKEALLALSYRVLGSTTDFTAEHARIVMALLANFERTVAPSPAPAQKTELVPVRWEWRNKINPVWLGTSKEDPGPMGEQYEKRALTPLSDAAAALSEERKRAEAAETERDEALADRNELHATVRKLNCDNADEFWAAIGRIRARAETAEARAEAAEATVERLRAALEAYEHFPEARAALQESTDG